MQVPSRALHHGVLLAGLMMLVTPRLAWTQCEIFGPTEVCGAPIQLCGPGDGGAYEWTGPSGFAAATQCIEVTEPGVYSLRWFDSMNGLWFGPCSQEVALGAGPAAAIAGPATACAGEPVELCGPPGDFAYAWSGPGGFVSDARCVSVANGGTYRLLVTPLAGGCPGPAAVHEVAFATCGQEPAACPKPPSWWLRQCAGGGLAEIRPCVDAMSGVVNGSGSASLCKVLQRRHDLRARARRHVAAVWANVCAGEQDLPAGGRGVSLPPGTTIELPGVRTTVGEWLAQAERTLAELENRPLRNHSVKHAYREIVRVGWHVDHGRGIGPTCAAAPPLAAVLVEDASAEAEMADDGASLGLAVVQSGLSTEVEFSVDSESFEEVSIAVFDVAGRRVADLADGPYAPGDHRVTWDGRLRDGTSARSGVFFVRGRIRDQVSEQRVTLLR